MARPKLSYKRSVSGFWPKPHPWPCVGKRAVPPVPPCHPLAPTISHYRPTLPSHTAHLKPSYKHSVLGFWPKPHPQLRIAEHAIPPAPPCHPPAPTTSCHRPTPLFHTAHPKPSHPSRFSGFLTLTPPSHTHAASPPQPPCPQHSPLPSMAICTGTEPLHSVFGFL